MNNTLKKIVRGTLAIFMIKLVLFGGLFIIQSCQKDDNSNIINDQAKTEFLTSLQISRTNLNIVQTENTKENNTTFKTNSTTDGETQVICLVDPPKDEEINGFGKIIQVVIDWDLVVTEIDNGEPSIDCYEVLVNDITEALNPSVASAKNYLLSYGYSNNEITEILDGEDETFLPALVYGMIAVDSESNGITYNNNELELLNNLLGIQSTYAQVSGGDIVGCAVAALGLDILEDIRTAKAKGKKIGKKFLKKAVKKVATKLLGPIGVAITIGQFAYCLAIAA